MPLRVALEKSLNLVTVRVADRVGMEAVAQTAIGFHVVDDMPRVLPAALGAVETTVLRQAAGYAGFAAGGREVLPTLIDSVQDRDGHVLWRAGGPDCNGCDEKSRPPVLIDNRKQVADPASTFQLVGMMQGVVQRGTGIHRRQRPGPRDRRQDRHQPGFQRRLVRRLHPRSRDRGLDWLRHPDDAGQQRNRQRRLAAPVWHDFMAFALKNRPNLKFIPPAGVTMAAWDSGSGTVTDAFKPGQTPGASGPMGGGGTASADAGAATGGSPHAAGVDSGLGGLY